MDDDAALVEAVLQGRTDAFGDLVTRHAPAVFRLIRAAVRQAADAEDLAQEAFLAAYRSLERLREPRRFRAYLLGIAARKAADHLRRKPRRPLPLEGEPVAPEPAPDRAPLLAAVARVVAGLPPEARLVFALRHHEGLSCVQIAELLDEPAGTVYSRLSRAHATIRKAVEVIDR